MTCCNVELHRRGDLVEAIDKLDEGGRSHVDSGTCILLLRQCANAKALAEGKRVHAHLSRTGEDRGTFLGNLLIQMYGKCGSMPDAAVVFGNLRQRNVFSWNIMVSANAQNGQLHNARALFDKMPQRDVVSWNVMIAGYVQNGHGREAIALYRIMHFEGGRPDKITFVNCLKSFTSWAWLAEGSWIHAHVVHSGLQHDVVVASALVEMYGKCGSIQDAVSVFQEIPGPDVVLCNALITAFFQNGQLQCAKDAFDKLPQRDVASWNALVSGYAQNGHLQDARRMFDTMPQRNVVSWNSMITAYAQNGHSEEAVKLFRIMDRDVVPPNRITCISVLEACADLGAIEEGRALHSYIVKNGLDSDVVVGNALVNMYAKCGNLEAAVSTYNKMPVRNVVSWNAMIAAYAQNGCNREALEHFKLMDFEGIQPNSITLSTVFDACGRLNALRDGKLLHAEILGSELSSEVAVGNSLVSMYGRCGSLDNAESVFKGMPQRNVVSWSAMITIYVQNGYDKEALEMLQSMNLEGISPNEITFISSLSACSHAGRFEDGLHCFSSISGDYGLTPSFDHYVCIIDVLGRAGQLNEAVKLIGSMPFEPDAVAWATLLAACRVQGDLRLGLLAAEHFRKLEPEKDASYVMQSNIWQQSSREDYKKKTCNDLYSPRRLIDIGSFYD